MSNYALRTEAISLDGDPWIDSFSGSDRLKLTLLRYFAKDSPSEVVLRDPVIRFTPNAPAFEFNVETMFTGVLGPVLSEVS